MNERKIACVDVDVAAAELHKAFSAFLYMNKTGAKAAIAAALEKPAGDLYTSDPSFKANVDSAVNRFMSVILKNCALIHEGQGFFLWNGQPSDLPHTNATRYLREHFVIRLDKEVKAQGINAMVLVPK